MGYIEQYFGKEANNLTFSDIENYFAQERVESDTIEFKAHVAQGDAREKEKAIFRTVCGFLNSSGGLVIWGAPKAQPVVGRKKDGFSGPLSPLNYCIEKDAFVNRLTDAITPAPAYVRFFPFERSGEFVYLIEVEQSGYSPHQFEKYYPMRIDGQTRPAPHYFVEALFKKITFPRLEGYLKLETYRYDGSRLRLGAAFLIFHKSRLQNAQGLFLQIVVTQAAVFARSQQGGTGFGMKGHEWKKKDEQTIYYNQPIRYLEELSVNPHELQQRQNLLEIWMVFGSTTTPLIRSWYKLRIDPTRAEVADLNTLIVEKEENKFWFEYEDRLGMTETERMRGILGR
jgi:hypothetical protein